MYKHVCSISVYDYQNFRVKIDTLPKIYQREEKYGLRQLKYFHNNISARPLLLSIHFHQELIVNHKE